MILIGYTLLAYLGMRAIVNSRAHRMKFKPNLILEKLNDLEFVAQLPEKDINYKFQLAQDVLTLRILNFQVSRYMMLSVPVIFVILMQFNIERPPSLELSIWIILIGIPVMLFIGFMLFNEEISDLKDVRKKLKEWSKELPTK